MYEELEKPHALVCNEVWGGNRRVIRTVELPSLLAWVASVPINEGEGGGDLHYMSVCDHDLISRVALADVSGHGREVNAVTQTLHKLMRKNVDAWDQSDFMRGLNDAFGQGGNDRYATAIVLSFHRVRGRLAFSNAGHLPPLWYHASQRVWGWLERSRGVVEGHLNSAFGTRKLADIRRGDIQRYATERSAKVSPGSVVKELNVLKHLLHLAMEWELIPTNPAQGVKLPRVPAGRVRYLQPAELRAVLAACPEWLRPIAALLAFTGMRRGEALSLRWLDVDRRGGRILLPQTKNGDGRVVWLNALACQVLDSLPTGEPTALVFPAGDEVRPENVSLAFLRACRKVGIANFRLHDLRHTAASWLRMRGADIHTVALLLGHKDLRMAARYQHLSPAYLQNAVKGLDGVFGPHTMELLMPNGEKSGEKSGHDEVTIEPKNDHKQVQTEPSQKSSATAGFSSGYAQLCEPVQTPTNIV